MQSDLVEAGHLTVIQVFGIKYRKPLYTAGMNKKEIEEYLNSLGIDARQMLDELKAVRQVVAALTQTKDSTSLVEDEQTANIPPPFTESMKKIWDVGRENKTNPPTKSPSFEELVAYMDQIQSSDKPNDGE